MAHCTGCGLWLREEDRFCGVCGTVRSHAVAGEVRASPTHRSKRGVREPSSSGGTTPSPKTVSAEPRAYENLSSRWKNGLFLAAPVIVWASTVFPFASALGGGGSDLLAAVVFSLGGASLLRGGYALLRRRKFLSPWLFAIAAVFALLSTVGHV